MSYLIPDRLEAARIRYQLRRIKKSLEAAAEVAPDSLSRTELRLAAAKVDRLIETTNERLPT